MERTDGSLYPYIDAKTSNISYRDLFQGNRNAANRNMDDSGKQVAMLINILVNGNSYAGS